MRTRCRRSDGSTCNLQRLVRSAPRPDIQLADRQALNVKLLNPSFQQAKSPYAQRSNRKSTDRCRAHRKSTNRRSTQCDRTNCPRARSHAAPDLHSSHRNLRCHRTRQTSPVSAVAFSRALNSGLVLDILLLIQLVVLLQFSGVINFLFKLRIPPIDSRLRTCRFTAGMLRRTTGRVVEPRRSTRPDRPQNLIKALIFRIFAHKHLRSPLDADSSLSGK